MADPFVPVVAAEQPDLPPGAPDLEKGDDEHSKQIKESENNQYYIPYARLAIEYHNIHHKTRFEFNCIEKVEKKSTEYDELFITFQVTDKNADAETAMKKFQANVICDIAGCLSGQPKVIFKNCSLVPTPTNNKGDHSSKDSESVIPIASPSTAGDSALTTPH